MLHRPNSSSAPPIASHHVQQFLRRERQDYRRFKGKDDAWLERQAAKLPFPPRSWARLRRDQKLCVLIGLSQPRFAFFNDPGTGKTLVSLSIADHLQQQNRLKRVLVLVPNLANKIEWERETRKHYGTSIRCLVLAGSSSEKWAQLEADTDSLVVVETYAGLARMASQKVATTPSKSKLEPSFQLVTKLMAMFDGLVLDESSEVKSHTTLIFRIARKLSEQATMVLALSGTPLGRDPHDLWSQLFLVDRGQTLGETISLYRSAFFTHKVNYWGGWEWTFKASMKPTLNTCIANRSLRFAVDEADLPDVSYIRKSVPLGTEAADWYARARDQLRDSRDRQTIEATFLRMRQLSSGFVGVPEQPGQRIEFADNPKLELLGSLVQEVPREYKVICFHEFIYSGERIAAELKRRDISTVALRGGVRDPGPILAQFADPAGPQVLVLNHEAGGFGLNLQIAKFALFYESPVSSIMRRQCEARILRQYSQHDRVVIYDLIVPGTVDETILRFHKLGDDLFRAVIEGRERL